MLTALLLALAPAAPQLPPGSVLETLRPGHPRLFLAEDRLAELRDLPDRDPLFARALEQVLARADALLDAPRLERRLIGPRLLSVSRTCLDRVWTLGFAWRWTGEAKYARAVEANLLAVCAFSDWNPSHFLDVAEMSHAVGLGFDWCHDALSAESRATVRSALVAKGLEPGLRAYEAPQPAWWVGSEFNWNQVCNGGLLVAALALAEEEPDRAERVVRRAVLSLPRALESYEPDGAWGEGPGYWSYATHYTVYALDALRTALGGDFGLGDRRGIDLAGWFPILCTGPSGRYACLADVGENARRGALPALFWLAWHSGQQAFAASERAWLAEHTASAQHLVWWRPEPAVELREPPLHKLFTGRVPVAVMRSGWAPEDFFVVIKGGDNQVNHGHLDLGSFEFEFDGVRWARDLGRDDYNLPGYWDKRPGGRRWSYYRLGSFSHNLLLPAGVQQHAAASARFTLWEHRPADGDRPWRQRARVRSDDLFPGLAGACERTLTLFADRGLLVEDRIELERDHELVWGMTTDAAIELADGGAGAALRLGGRRLGARVLLPAGARFSVAGAEQEPPQARNEGVRRLEVRVPGRAGPNRVVVAFDPVRNVLPPLPRAVLLAETEE
ncbi:MAG: heparinase [Planctomycetota bacterium]|nr:MAG: heparinase [Planctomycetota bacterium]